MIKIRKILIFSLIFILANFTSTYSQTKDEQPFETSKLKEMVLSTLRRMEPPITDIYYYEIYKWTLCSHKIKAIRYVGDENWQIVSLASFKGYFREMFVGKDRCYLHWRFNEKEGRLSLIETELAAMEGSQPMYSRTQVISNVGMHLSDMYYDNAKLNWHDTAHWKLTYIGAGIWEVRVIITNAVGLWHFHEESKKVEFCGRIGPR
jgi:hypothetical protein